MEPRPRHHLRGRAGRLPEAGLVLGGARLRQLRGDRAGGAAADRRQPRRRHAAAARRHRLRRDLAISRLVS